LISALDAERVRADASERRAWLTVLEQLAVTAERDLPYALRSGDPDSQDAITARCRSAAAVLRDLKRTVAMPDEKSWQAMTGQLKGLAAAIASGSFERWPVPQAAVPVPLVKRSLWWHLMQAGRIILVIIGFPLVAFLVPHVAPVTGPGLGWLQSASLVWAVRRTARCLTAHYQLRQRRLHRGGQPPPRSRVHGHHAGLRQSCSRTRSRHGGPRRAPSGAEFGLVGGRHSRPILLLMSDRLSPRL
jgi:hypothetical protein